MNVSENSTNLSKPSNNLLIPTQKSVGVGPHTLVVNITAFITHLLQLKLIIRGVAFD